MKLYHDCDLPGMNFAKVDASRVRRYWKCEICGEKWVITHYRYGGRVSSRLWPAGIKKWLWSRRQRKLMTR